MTDKETYITKKNPTEDDWLEFNKDLFAVIRGENPENPPHYAPFVDVDVKAEEAGMSTAEYFERIKNRVGPLGRAALRLLHTDMDDSWHIVIGRSGDDEEI